MYYIYIFFIFLYIHVFICFYFFHFAFNFQSTVCWVGSRSRFVEICLIILLHVVLVIALRIGVLRLCIVSHVTHERTVRHVRGNTQELLKRLTPPSWMFERIKKTNSTHVGEISPRRNHYVSTKGNRKIFNLQRDYHVDQYVDSHSWLQTNFFEDWISFLYVWKIIILRNN